MKQVAEDTRYFTYLSTARSRGATIGVVLGDARLTLAKADDGGYDAMILDAFSSDSIPAHLLTVEALSSYRKKLRADGVLAFHLSNRHLDVLSVVAALAKSSGLAGLRIQETTAPAGDGTSASTWAVLAASRERLDQLVSRKDWQPLSTSVTRRPRTDDHSDVWSVLRLSEATERAH